MPAGILFGTEGGSGLLPLLRRMPPALPPDSNDPATAHRATVPAGNCPADKHPVSTHPSGNRPGRNQTPAEIRHRPKSDTGEAAKNSPHGWQAVRGIV